jgi:hypothetical protein
VILAVPAGKWVGQTAAIKAPQGTLKHTMSLANERLEAVRCRVRKPHAYTPNAWNGKASQVLLRFERPQQQHYG